MDRCFVGISLVCLHARVNYKHKIQMNFLTCGVKDDGSSRKNHKVGKRLEIFVGLLGNIILHFYACMCACIPRGDFNGMIYYRK